MQKQQILKVEGIVSKHTPFVLPVEVGGTILNLKLKQPCKRYAVFCAENTKDAIAIGTSDKTINIDLGYTDTKCLIVEAVPNEGVEAVEVTVLLTK